MIGRALYQGAFTLRQTLDVAHSKWSWEIWNIVVQNDEKVLQALHRGNQEAYAQLVAEHAGRVYGLAFRMLHNPAEAEDVLQETFIKAFRNIHRFEGRSRLGTWLYRIAANESLMRLRRKETPTVSIDELNVPQSGGNPQLRPPVDWTNLPEDVLLSNEAREMMGRAVAKLSDALRPVFVLRDMEGFSTEETAQMLGISQSATKTRLHRARLILRDQLSDYFSEHLVLNAER